jgi:hypothetical protein
MKMTGKERKDMGTLETEDLKSPSRSYITISQVRPPAEEFTNQEMANVSIGIGCKRKASCIAEIKG